MLLAAVFLGVGIALLYFGGELLVDGATRLAQLLGMKPLVIGLTVVAFGTSSPEIAATLVATLEGAPQLALGNVFGSNIANIGLILGLSAVLAPLVAESRFVNREIPFLIFISFLVAPLAFFGGGFSLIDSLLLLILMAVYLFVLLRDGESRVVEEQFEQLVSAEVPAADAFPSKSLEAAKSSRWPSILRVVAGIVLLVLGAEALVRGAVDIARAFGFSDRVIGISLVALGTSLPELAGCLVATLRRQGDLILGNVIGSNIFNVLLILGLTVLVRPIEVTWGELVPDLSVMILFAVVLVPLLLMGRRRVLHRWEGALLLLGYLGYMVWLFLHG